MKTEMILSFVKDYIDEQTDVIEKLRVLQEMEELPIEQRPYSIQEISCQKAECTSRLMHLRFELKEVKNEIL